MFERVMWGWLALYADILTAVGLVGLLVIVTRGLMAFGDIAAKIGGK